MPVDASVNAPPSACTSARAREAAPERGRGEVWSIDPDELDNLVADDNACYFGGTARLYRIHPAADRNKACEWNGKKHVMSGCRM